MRKIHILDTSALISDPFTYKHFHQSDVIIPIAVINELDNLKKQTNDVGKNARVCIRNLDEISSLGDISTGILLDNDILLKIDAFYYDTKSDQFNGLGDPTYGDTQILACALSHYKNNLDKEVVFVSNDLNLRVKAKSRSLMAIEHEGPRHSVSELYSGTHIVKDEHLGLELQGRGAIDPTEHGLVLYPHQCVLFEDELGNPISLGRKVDDHKVKLIKKHFPWGIASKNKEQSFAMDLIMDPSVDLVTLIGKAGTGKSLVVLASALELVLSKKKYNKFIIYRPIQPVGKDIGYLPGTLAEKLEPWFQAIMDNFETLFSSKSGGDWKKNLEIYQKRGLIEMEAITYIRGRSIPNAIILIDECQNLSKEEVKTILTRAGEDTKIILTGDLEQIDNGELDATNNGLSHIIEKFKDCDMAGHVTFVQGERSRLASYAANIL